MSVFAQRCVSLLGVCALLFAVAVPPGGILAAREDVNGDRKVDVRDLQLIVTRMLLGCDQSEASDVNGDGVVDVLDLQRALAVARSSQSHESAPAKDGADGCFLVSQFLGVPKIPVQGTAVVLESVPDREWSRTERQQEEDAVPAAPVRRYLFRLSPNAPPSVV